MGKPKLLIEKVISISHTPHIKCEAEITLRVDLSDYIGKIDKPFFQHINESELSMLIESDKIGFSTKAAETRNQLSNEIKKKRKEIAELSKRLREELGNKNN